MGASSANWKIKQVPGKIKYLTVSVEKEKDF